MQYLVTIAYLSSFIWILVPFIQRKSECFFYFLILAIAGLYGIIVYTFSLGAPWHIMLPAAVLMFPGIYRSFFRKYYLAMIIAASLLFFFTFYISFSQVQLFALVAYIITLIIMVFRIFKTLLENQIINTTYIIILIYQLSIVLKYIVLMRDPGKGLILFFISAALEIIVGLSLLFIKEDSSKFNIALK